MVRECRGTTEIAVMEMPQVGVKTRTRARATATTTTATASTEMNKKRKLSDGEMRISASYIQLRSRRITLQNSNSKQEGGNISRSSNTLSPSSDHVSASCCSSNGSSQEVNERIKFIDLEDENVEGEVETSPYYSWREERRETTPLSEFRDESYDLDSTTNPSTEANSRLGGGSTVEKKKMMPTESELDEFFATAEKNLQKQFADKYNYDIVKDEPIEGCYEWVRLRP